MKTKLTLLLLLFTTATFAQTIRRVNNNGVTGTNIYSTIQAAHDAAVNGDIIYVEGTKTVYAGFTCTKQLTFIGAGYFLVENGPLQADVLESSINSAVYFNTGSSGSQFYGMHFVGGSQTLYINTSNITISRNYLQYVVLGSTLSNILISQNYIYLAISAGTAISNLTISNNILSSSIGLSNSVSGLFTNNTITTEVTANSNISNFVVSNNIMAGTSTLSLNNNTFSNNIGASSQFPSGNGNLQNVIMTNVFIADPAPAILLDSRWKLKTGSPAIGAGVGGIDCGAFGGANPYVLSGIPPYPTITSLINSGVGNSTTPINVVISTKSN
jgi:hypothetical protein